MGGEVAHPGPIPLDGPTTIIEAIFQAGGPRMESAELSNVVILRRLTSKEEDQWVTSKDRPVGENASVVTVRLQRGGVEERWVGFTYDLERALAGETTKSVYLHPRDIVFLPRTRIVRMNQWMDQYFNKLVPGAQFIEQVGKTTVGVDLGGRR